MIHDDDDDYDDDDDDDDDGKLNLDLPLWGLAKRGNQQASSPQRVISIVFFISW